MKNALSCIWIFIFFLASLPEKAWPDSADFFYQAGMALLEKNHLDEAEAQFLLAIQKRKKHAPAYVGLGHVYLKRDDLKTAEAMFKKARSVQQSYAPAHNGLGLVALQQPLELMWAMEYFRTATKRDPAYAEAYYNLARAYRQIGDTKELEVYQALVKVVPDHADAWFQIGRVYRDGMAGQFRDIEKAEQAYRQQLEVNPRHYEAMVHLGGVLKLRGQTDEALGLLKQVADVPNAHQQEAVVELAMVYQRQREYDQAEALFNRYLNELNELERQVYFDLSLVVKDEELAAFQAASKETWQGLSEVFWASRDPAPVTAANERRIEHYRRVAFARENFSEFLFPWDVRGDVYVRYGEPDHVSSSTDIRFETDPRVLGVKEKLLLQAGDAVTALKIGQGAMLDEADIQIEMDGPNPPLGPMSSILKEIAETGGFRTTNADKEAQGIGGTPVGDKGKMDMLLKASSLLGWPVYPVRDKVWEYWIYTGVGNGFEVLFTKNQPGGPFGYPEPPLGIGLRTGRSSRHFTTWQRMNSAVVIDRVAAFQPEYYWPDFATGPMEFYFDAATFKGEGGATALEVYFGVPVGDLSYVQEAGGKQTAVVKRGVALFDGDNRPVYRADDEMVYESDGAMDTAQLAFIPEQKRLTVPPGTYRISVQVLDAASHKSQVYNAMVRLNDYTLPGLRLSSIQLASAIHPVPKGKFIKGDVAVVPNPTQSYLSGQPVYLYYEIYNLQRDKFGRTHYRVVYEVQSGTSQNLAVQALRGLGQLLGIRRDEKGVTIAYEQVGDRQDEIGYVGLNLEQAGVGEQVVKVEVIDENAKQIARSTVRFVIR